MFFREDPQISNHARERMVLRDVREDEIFAVLDRGSRIPRHDSVRCQVHESDLDANADPCLFNLVGIVVVLTLDGRMVKTVFRTEERRYPRPVLRYLGSRRPRFKLGDLIGPLLPTRQNDTDEES